MTRSANRALYVFFLLLVCACPTLAQTANQQTAVIEQAPAHRSSALPPTKDFRKFVRNGKLQLWLADAIVLALENNTDIQVDQSQIDTANTAIGLAHSPFDPTVSGAFSTQRSTQSSFSQAAVAPTLSGLTQSYELGFSQTLETGTTVQTFVNATKFSSNINFGFVNPSVFGTFSIQVTQPLLRGFGLLPNRGSIIVAQKHLAQSRATFRQQVATVMLSVITQYWNVVQARENLDVTQSLLSQAQQSYDRDKLALQKGALPPLDIYRSESQVAQHRVSEIQAEYALKQADDAFRHIIAADVDPNIRALDLSLTEEPEPSDQLLSVDIGTELKKALAHRPEMEAQRVQLQSDDLNIKIAQNGLKP